MTSDDGYQTPSMSRREALAGGSAAAVAVGAGLMSSSLVRRAQAQLSAGDARIVMGDQGESPAQNGEIAFNSPDVEVFTGGSVVNLSSPVDGTDISPSSVANTKYLYGSNNPTVSDINTALTNHNLVVLVGDHTSLSDRIEAQNANTTLVIAEGATLKLADGATPTEVAFAGGSKAVTIYNDGIDDFHVIVRGVIDANNTNHTNASPMYVDGTTTAVNGGSIHVTESGNLVDVNTGAFVEGANNFEVPRAFSDDTNNAALGIQNCTGVDVGTVHAIDSAEAIDINGGNVGVNVDTAIGDNISEEIVDINGQEDITIQSVVGVNTPSTGVRVGAADEVTIGSIVGHYANQALLTTQGKHNQLHAHLNTSSPQRTVYIRGGSNGDLDGLRLTGHVEMTNSTGGDKAMRIDADNASNGSVSEDLHLDVEVVSANETGLEVAGFHGITGTVHAHDCAAKGFDFRGSCQDADITVYSHDNTDGWKVRFRGDDSTIRGNVAESALRIDGTDVRVECQYGGLDDGGTRTRDHGVASAALGGSAPATPANWDVGDVVEDTDNAGDAYLKLPSSGFSQIST